MSKYRFKVKPYKHQFDDWDKTKRNKYWAHLFDMGTGKSKLILDIVAYMYDQGWIDALLIFANKGSYTNWIDEHVPEHLADHINYEIALWRSDAKVKEKEKIKEVFYSSKLTLKIFVMNIEALSHKRTANIALKFAQRHKTFTVIDESTTIKNPKARRTKAAWKIGKASAARRILTGSLVDNKPLDAWAQFQFLDNGILGHTSYYSFRSEYAELIEMSTKQQRRPFKVVVGYKNLERLRNKITRYGTIIKSEDCLDLPPRIYEKFYVDLTEEQQRHYTDLNKRLITELEDQKRVTVKIALTKILRLQQLLGGYLKDDDGVVHLVPHHRLKALDAVLDEIRGKVIIWSPFRHDIEEIYKHLVKAYDKETALKYYGDTKQDDRDIAKKAFRRGTRTKVRFLVGNPSVGGYGLNLTGANTVIYYSNSYDYEKRSQSEKRAHRIGQTRTVTYIDLVAPKTVDEKVLKALYNKKSISDMITATNWREFF